MEKAKKGLNQGVAVSYNDFFKKLYEASGGGSTPTPTTPTIAPSTATGSDWLKQNESTTGGYTGGTTKTVGPIFNPSSGTPLY